ncbi:hypothetical protein KO02_05320 [Sphingobacterium sp. ML3W]|uniref:hypothetical protein n=1 Tax=Sphingobacterium sp. ML3W TaxID=1538644 RepID=UPI0004F8659B|nr:hypothetical protein [Sphingobacterium sp. ML3W]AIM36179.1 hypothetical protein KO02_05320 [Sphingobacterium sp. ML3W]
MNWFKLSATGNPLTPNNYTLETTPPSCGGQDQICAVQANADTSGLKPELSATLKDEMITALHSGQESANVKLRDR